MSIFSIFMRSIFLCINYLVLTYMACYYDAWGPFTCVFEKMSKPVMGKSHTRMEFCEVQIK